MFIDEWFCTDITTGVSASLRLWCPIIIMIFVCVEILEVLFIIPGVISARHIKNLRTFEIFLKKTHPIKHKPFV